MKYWLALWLTAALLGTYTFGAGPVGSLPTQVPTPSDNKITSDKIELGKKLFFDPRLSKDGTISCSSCHNVMSGGSDGRSVSIGVGGKAGTRNSPTVWNSAFLSVQFWDGREPDLEHQAKGPLTNPVEMAMTSHKEVEQRVASIPGYVEEFRKVFGKSVTIDNIAKAIATYERTLITPNSPFDKFIDGQGSALTPAAKRGYATFQSTGCIACHSGPLLAGPQLPLGTGFYQKFPTFSDNKYVAKYKLLGDKGRFEATKKQSDEHFFRVPTLRNVALSAPYFHNGSVNSLEEAVRVMAKTQLDKTLAAKDVDDIVAFLNSLTGEFPKQSMPRLPQTPGKSIVGG